MKKRSLGKSIFILAYTILLCVTVSFAWILAQKPNEVQRVDIDYSEKGKLVIAPTDIEGSVYVTTSEGEEIELTQDFKISSSEVLPNSVIPFKIRLKNNTDSVTRVDVSIVGIQTSRANLLDVVFFSATPSTGWTETNVPNSVYKQLGEANQSSSTGKYSLSVLSGISLRTTDKEKEDDYLEFSCYFYFDGETMGNEHQNADLTIGAFRIIQK